MILSASTSPVKQAVIPVAGRGTRFLPFTRSVPKELLPIAARPLLDYALEEARLAGIERLVLVTAKGKDALLDYCDDDSVAKDLDIAFVRQNQPLGLGHAVLCGGAFLDQTAPFAVILPDDLILPEEGQDPQIPGCLQQMCEAWKTRVAQQENNGASLLAIMSVPDDQVSRFGIIDTNNPDATMPEIRGLVEKPPLREKPSNLAVIGRYILSPAVLSALKQTRPGALGEIQLTDAIAATIGQNSVYGFRFRGRRYDCGNPKGWLQANQTVADYSAA